MAVRETIEAFQSLNAATAPGLTRKLSADRIAALSDDVFLSGGLPRASFEGAALPWIVGWSEIDARLDDEILHANGSSHRDVRSDLREFVADLSPEGVAFGRKLLRIRGDHLFQSERAEFETALRSHASKAFCDCALSLLVDGKVIAFAPGDHGLMVKPGREWRAWRAPVKTRDRRAWRFLVVQDLPQNLSAEEKGGLRSRKRIGAERAAGDLLESLATIEGAPRKNSVLSYLQDRFEGLSRKAAERVWDARAPIHWKTPGPKTADLVDLLPDGWSPD